MHKETILKQLGFGLVKTKWKLKWVDFQVFGPLRIRDFVGGEQNLQTSFVWQIEVEMSPGRTARSWPSTCCARQAARRGSSSRDFCDPEGVGASKPWAPSAAVALGKTPANSRPDVFFVFCLMLALCVLFLAVEVLNC